MNISIVGNEQQAAPILTQLGDVGKLYDLAKDKNPDARAELSRVIGSILEEDLSPRQSELVADVLIKLMRQAEKDLRKVISKQVSIIDDAPLRLVLQLANDDIEIAKPVLSKSNVLGDLDLMYIIKSKTTEYWQVIAAREVLNDQVIDILADTKDFDTALTLAKNDNITLTDHALNALSDLAQESEVMAVPLLRRDEVSSEIAARLYEYVGAEVKRFISDNYEIDAKEVCTAIDRAVDEFIAPKSVKGFTPDDYMIRAAQKFKEKKMLNISLMLSTLRVGHIRSFIAQFSVYTEISVDTVCNILSQTDGKGLAIACKACDIKKQDFISIFMLSSKIWNNGRLVDMGEIQAAISFYNQVTPELSAEIIKNYKEK